jgi:very-short-patch-repair endonuclease
MTSQIDKTNLFISKAKEIHGDRYDYSKASYINAKTKIMIICNVHGIFEQTPSNHLSNYNCQKCSNNYKLDTLSFIEKAKNIHNDRYNYSKVNYVNANTLITIICKEHGEFNQIPDFHINRKCGCPKCSNNLKNDTSGFIEKANKIHNNKYNYSKVEYINNRKQIIIICNIHGEFMQQPFVHLSSHGCPSCINKTEFIFFTKMQQFYPTIKRQFKVQWCKNKLYLPFDFVIEEYKIILEMDGQQHFEQISNWTSPEIQIEKDKYKIKCANENGFSVIRILQNDVSKDNFDWLTEINTSISKIIDEKKVQNIFICKNNEYNIFICKNNEYSIFNL